MAQAQRGVTGDRSLVKATCRWWRQVRQRKAVAREAPNQPLQQTAAAVLVPRDILVQNAAAAAERCRSAYSSPIALEQLGGVGAKP